MKDSSVFNPSIAKEVRSVRMDLDDTSQPLFLMKWGDIGKDPSSPNEWAQITIDADASDDSFLIVYVDIGPSSSDYTQYQFSSSSVAVADPAGVDGSPTMTECDTLGDLVDALNDVDGLTCHRLHAPADYSLATNDFIDLAASNLNAIKTEYLYKDASEVLTCALRIGVPEQYDGGNIEFIRAIAFANSNSATDCTFKVSYDPTDGSGGADDEVELAYTRAIPDAAITELYDFYEAPPVEKGPILVEITSVVSLAAAAYVIVQYRSAEW